MLRLLGLTFLLSLSAYIYADPVADTHTEMGSCESCHIADGPSADLAHENAACVECHGFLKGFADETHIKHDGILECSSCHFAHEEVSPSESCVNCH